MFRVYVFSCALTYCRWMSDLVLKNVFRMYLNAIMHFKFGNHAQPRNGKYGTCIVYCTHIQTHTHYRKKLGTYPFWWNTVAYSHWKYMYTHHQYNLLTGNVILQFKNSFFWSSNRDYWMYCVSDFIWETYCMDSNTASNDDWLRSLKKYLKY